MKTLLIVILLLTLNVSVQSLMAEQNSVVVNLTQTSSSETEYDSGDFLELSPEELKEMEEAERKRQLITESYSGKLVCNVSNSDVYSERDLISATQLKKSICGTTEISPGCVSGWYGDLTKTKKGFKIQSTVSGNTIVGITMTHIQSGISASFLDHFIKNNGAMSLKLTIPDKKDPKKMVTWDTTCLMLPAEY